MNETKRTLKGKKFIEAYIKHEGNLTKAYLEISPGCKISSARVLGYRWLQKVNIPAQELLDRLGLDDFTLSQKLKEGLEAVKTIAGVGGSVEVPDHNVRVKYLDMAFKLKNIYPVNKIEGKIDITTDKGFSYEEYLRIKNMTDEERNGLIERLSKVCRIDKKGDDKL